MKYTYLFIASLMLSSCVSIRNQHRVVKPEKFYSDYYAEWGERNGQEYEDRYDAMQCGLYENRKRIGDLIIYQHWFKKDRKEYPQLGTSIQIKKCDFDQNLFGDTNGTYAVEADRFEGIKIKKR